MLEVKVLSPQFIKSPMKPQIPPRKPRDMTLVVHCQKCGHGKILASGYNATEMPRARVFEILKHIGWQFVPAILCPSCACPMTAEEMVEAMNLRALNHPQKINFALQSFRHKMLRKYHADALKVDAFFRHRDSD